MSEQQQDIDSEVLELARRQTSALESLRGIALLWSAIGGLVLVIVLITWVNAGR